MVAYRFVVKTQVLTIRGHNKLMNRMYRQLGHRHKRIVIKKHFENVPETSPGGGGYGYGRRTKRWQQFKLRKLGFNKPLVFRGDLKRKVLNESRITATKSRFRFQARSPFPLTPQRRHELEMMSRGEKRDNIRLMKKLYPLAAQLPMYQEFRRKIIR